jgi:hypothetical protein
VVEAAWVPVLVSPWVVEGVWVPVLVSPWVVEAAWVLVCVSLWVVCEALLDDVDVSDSVTVNDTSTFVDDVCSGVVDAVSAGVVEDVCIVGVVDVDDEIDAVANMEVLVDVDVVVVVM